MQTADSLMRQSGRNGNWKRCVVGAMFLVLYVLQFADLHSTLAASHAQAETNRMLLWLQQWISPLSALFVCKGVALLFVRLLQRTWDGGGQESDGVWLAFVSATCCVVGATVVNNYMGH